MDVTSSALLEVHDLSKTFGGLLAVNRLSFSVREGEILGLLGPNGSGKTTVFNLIAGALRPNEGHVRFRGRKITHLAPHRRAALGLARTFQLVRAFPAMSTLDNVVVARLYGHARARSLAQAQLDGGELLTLVGLSDKAHLRTSALTLAERKRLELARALALDPVVLLLDEPLGGLNATEVREALALFRRIHAQSVTLVIVEHNVPAVKALCERVIVLSSGRKIAEGAAAEALADPHVIEVYLGKAAPPSSVVS